MLRKKEKHDDYKGESFCMEIWDLRWLVCRLERQWRKQFENVHCHCSEDTHKQQGAGQFWQEKQSRHISYNPHPLRPPLRLHKPYIPLKVRLSKTNNSHYVLPINNFFTLCPYEVLFFRRQDAQWVFLASPGLSIDDIRALVHVNCSLW